VLTEYFGEGGNDVGTLTRVEFIEELRKWIGTPFHHQGRWRGLGVDCAGLIVMPLYDLGVVDILKADNRTYQRKAGHKILLERLKLVADEIPREEMELGDIMLFTIYKYPQHLAVKSYGNNIIHVTEEYGVIEEEIDDMWEKRFMGPFRLKYFKD